MNDTGPGHVYEHWARLKERGVSIIILNPLRLFYLHDLIYWSDLYNSQET